MGLTMIVRARMAGDGAAIVIRQAKFYGGDAELVQPAADVLLLFPAGIPLRQNDYRRTAAARPEQLRVHAIIFGPGRFDGAGEGEDVVGESVVVGGSGGEPFVAVCYRFACEILQPAARVGFVRRAADVLQSPGERQDATIRLLREAHLFVSQDLLFDPGHEV